MKKFIPILEKSRMFSGIDGSEIESMLACLGARVGCYKKGETVLRQGESAADITLLLEGELHIQSDDFWGNRTILGHVSVGETFGEAYVTAEGGGLLNDVVAVEDSTVAFFDVNRVLTTCPSSCRFHNLVVQNVFFSISEKNRRLVQKLAHISRRTTREKLISYLSQEASRQGGGEFVIPFNRQQLADYLSVDRSAMSAELCRMRDEGLLEFHKNSFKLL